MMSQPTGDQIRASLAAMREDAAMWRHMAGELTEAAKIADRLDLEALHFSYVGDKLGMTRTYQAIQAKMIALMTQGAANFATIAQALNKAADGYEEDDRRGAHRLNNTY
jgi:uncharacterized protein YukE